MIICTNTKCVFLTNKCILCNPLEYEYLVRIYDVFLRGRGWWLFELNVLFWTYLKHMIDDIQGTVSRSANPHYIRLWVSVCLGKIPSWWFYIVVKSPLFIVFMIKRLKGASAARAHGVLMMKILNKCVYSFLHTPHYFHTSIIGCVHELEITFFKIND